VVQHVKIEARTMAGRKINRVAIVGCGIAGPVLGMFLQRVGIESTSASGDRTTRSAKDCSWAWRRTA
jgi:threonine dehydrogenase-like Zn-dependent dehydrogenase